MSPEDATNKSIPSRQISDLILLVGEQEVHPACKKLGVGLLVVTIWLELYTSYSSSRHQQLHHP